MTSNSDNKEEEEEEKPEKKLVGVRITEDRRERWKSYVEESDEFGSMAQMMRAGVEQIMSDQDDTTALIEDLEDDLTRLNRKVSKTKEAVEELPLEIDDAEETAEEVIYRLQNLESDGVER